jgi:hypothetical protein
MPNVFKIYPHVSEIGISATNLWGQKMFRKVAYSTMLFGLLGHGASGAILSPGGFVNLTEIDANDPSLAGAVVASTTSSVAINPGGALQWHFTVEATVKRIPSGTLDFYYRITNDTAEPMMVGFLDIRGTTGILADLSYLSGGATSPVPLYGIRTTDGSKIEFSSFLPGFVQGDNTRLVLLRSNSLDYKGDSPATLGAVLSSDEDPGVLGVKDFTTLAPVPVPEPSTFVLYAGLSLYIFCKRPKH